MAVGTTEIAALTENDGRDFAGIIDEGYLLKASDLHLNSILPSQGKFLLLSLVPLLYRPKITYDP